MKILKVPKRNKELIISVPDRITTNKNRTTFFAGTDKKVILTGHQQIFYHPGILVKNRLTYLIAKKYSGKAINFILDSNHNKFKIPSKGPDGFKITEWTVSENWRKDLLQIEQLLISLGDKKIVSAFKNANLEELPSTSVTEIRQRYEQEVLGIKLEYVEISTICKTDEFKHFFNLILRNYKDFFQIYNSELQNYRNIHNIKDRINPAPELRQVNGKYELPFWINKDGKKFSFFYPTDELHNITPKAITFTLFCRLYLCDLFVHGISGAKYDEVTDELARKFFHINLPAYAVGSGTLYLPLIDGFSLSELKLKLRDMEQHPENYVDKYKNSSIIKEKIEIINRMNKENKAMLHKQLKKLNEILKKEIEPEILNYKKLISNLSTEDKYVLQTRDYPYFIYPQDYLKEFLEFEI